MVRVLIADDEPGIRALVADVLAEEGYQVQTAGDGLSALLAIRADPPALVLLDVAMPGMTGDELARQLDAEGPRVPIIIMTAGTNPERFLKHGASAVLAKPFNLPALLTLVEDLLGRQRGSRERSVGGRDTSASA